MKVVCFYFFLENMFVLALILVLLGGILVAPLFVTVIIEVSAIARYISTNRPGSVHDASGLLFVITQANTGLAFFLSLRCPFGVIIFATFL